MSVLEPASKYGLVYREETFTLASNITISPGVATTPVLWMTAPTVIVTGFTVVTWSGKSALNAGSLELQTQASDNGAWARVYKPTFSHLGSGSTYTDVAVKATNLRRFRIKNTSNRTINNVTCTVKVRGWTPPTESLVCPFDEHYSVQA